MVRTCYEEEQLDLFRYPARILIAGFSNSGKSELTRKIIQRYHKKFTHIVISGTTSHPLESNPDIGPKLSLNQDIIDPMSEVDGFEDHNILYVIDDLFQEACESKIISDCFTKGRHKNISVILITQNLFLKGKYARTISLNCSHYILLRTRDLTQIEMIGRQIFGGGGTSKKFLDVYKTVVMGRPFSYLLVDMALNTPPELELRSNIVGEWPGELVFLEWQT